MSYLADSAPKEFAVFSDDQKRQFEEFGYFVVEQALPPDLFMDGALTHGTRPWQGEGQRRSILFRYAARNSVRGGVATRFAAPEKFWPAEIVSEMTPEQNAVMFGPYSNSVQGIPYPYIDDEGVVRAEVGN